MDYPEIENPNKEDPGPGEESAGNKSPKGDLTGQSMADQVRARVAAEDLADGSSSPVEPLPPGTPAKVDPKYTRNCLDANELGDGLLFAALHRPNYLFNTTSEAWLKWQGHFWVKDELSEVLAAVEDVVDLYHTEAARLADQKIGDSDKGEISASIKLKNQYLKKATRLRSVPGRHRCLKFAAHNREPMAVQANRFDSHPMLLATRSGVIDLETGRCRPGQQKEFITKASPVVWQGIKAEAPKFKAALQDIFGGNQGIIGYLQRLLGYGITGQVTEHIFPVFQGKGRNGKSMLLNIVKEAVGSLASPIRPELLLDQGAGRSAAAPSPDIMALQGLRMALAEETDEGSKFSASRVKHFTGGTALSGRNPHDKYDTTFNPTHLLCLCTNSRPAAPAADHAFWARMRLIEFRLSFVDSPVHDHELQINRKLPAEIITDELPGVLAWLVEGCLKWQNQGLKPPAEVLTATRNYRLDMDMAGDFIDECLIEDPASSVRSTDIYQLFIGWYNITQGRRVPSQSWLGRQLAGRFDRRKSHGIYKYFGIRINDTATTQYTENQ